MFPFRTVELAFRRFQRHREPRALALVFDRTAADLLALARHLAPPGTEAEDLVQATFVTAIEAAATHRPGERVLPWLCGILANHARAARRQGRRQPDPTRLQQPVGDPAAAAAAAELHAELAAAIDRLPDAYRPVLRLVLAHGLQAHEVARALDRPAGTVRAQVARGLDRLRRSLPASLAGSAAVTLAAGRGLAAVRRAVLSGPGGMGSGQLPPQLVGRGLAHSARFAAAAAVLVAATLGGLWLRQGPPPPRMAAPTAAADPGSTAPAPATAPADSERDRFAAAESTATSPAVIGSMPPAAPPASHAGSLVVLVRDQTGAAVAGVRVAVFPIAELADPGRRPDYVATDASGRVRFDGLAAADLAIDVDRAGMCGTATARPGTVVERALVLPPGLRAAGRVVDRRGAPVAGASVVLHGSRAAAVPVATTDAHGAFAVDHLAPGLELQARAPCRVPSLAHPVGGTPLDEVGLELVLGDASARAHGVVLDAAGHAVADAVVAILPSRACRPALPHPGRPQVRAHWVRTGTDGAFASDEVAAEPLLVFAQRLPFAPAWVEVDASRGTASATLTLGPGGVLTGRAMRGAAPLAGAQVSLWPRDEAPIGYLLNLFGQRLATTGEDGTFRIDGVVPGSHVARVLQGTNLLRQGSLEFAAGTTTEWHVDLAAATGLRLRVECAEPLHGLALQVLVYPNPLQDGVPPSMVPLRHDGTASVRKACDGDVDVILCTLPGGRSLVQVAAVRAVPPNQEEVVLEVRPGQLPRRSIRGRLVDAQRAPQGGHVVTAVRADASGLVGRLEVNTAADGSFRLGPLPAGGYRLVAGALSGAVEVGAVVLTADRDEEVGDLVGPVR
ncbi:MAG: sigma-70 family RNA polymerase sigma factor [Planctomycetes bacterium]|nr:sigma-70 family RNA polymerase sigma factor [Planctomycetota bacterium]